MQTWQWILFITAFPALGAAIGWLTNRLAIQMLFRPRKPVRCLGVSFQGLIPRRHLELADKVGQIVEEELFSQHLIREEIMNIDLDPHLQTLARKVVRDRLAPKLQQIPLLGSLLGGQAMDSLEKLAADSIRAETLPLLQQVAGEVERRIKVRQLVEQKIRDFDLDKLESIIRELANREFSRIEWLGAVIGGLVGCVQSLLLLLMQLA
jgi:uncharacterized membrane protein YheB (UPF0754 family)